MIGFDFSLGAGIRKGRPRGTTSTGNGCCNLGSGNWSENGPTGVDLSLLEEQSDGGAETNATVGPQPISYLP